MEILSITPAQRSTFGCWLKTCQGRLRELWRTQQKQRSLSIKETAGLGERRFVAVVQFERQRFLIGGSAGSVTLLAELPAEDPTREQP
jgi:flagellar biogenesis protein FliO